MKIAIIGTGNVGGTLAGKWADRGHEISLGVRNTAEFKGKHLLDHPRIEAYSVQDAVAKSDLVLISTPAMTAVEVAESLGDTNGKILIDTMNIVMGRGPAGYHTTSEAILDHTASNVVIKCFNTTGFNNMVNPVYDGKAIEVFMAGDDRDAKAMVKQLALDAGFSDCIDVGGNDRFQLMEQFAWFWINLAMFQGQGREFAFKMMKR